MTREKPIIHPVAAPPLCDLCQRKNYEQFSFDCTSCQEELLSETCTIAELFAVLRIWTPHAQKNLEILIREILKKGANINDRDSITDMTLLHYASKSGAAGVGDAEEACRMVLLLLSKQADIFVRSRWTDMAAIHFAVFFDVAPVVEILLKASRNLDINSRCSQMENGTLLHIAATNFAWKTVQVLLKNGANPLEKDDLGRTPLECVVVSNVTLPNSPTAEAAERTRNLLYEALNAPTGNFDWLSTQRPNTQLSINENGDPVQPVNEHRPRFSHQISEKVNINPHVREAHMSVGLKIGERVIVGGLKNGTLRFCGTTQFASGMWAGIELDEPVGKNDGSVAGIQYFTCQPSYGIFAPLSKVSKSLPSAPLAVSHAAAVTNGRIDTSHVIAKINTGLNRESDTSKQSQPLPGIAIGDRVIVAGQKLGTVLFAGITDFAPGWWYGVELDQAIGRNDGSINGKRYFSCEANRGVFAPPSRVQKLDENGPSTSVTNSGLMKQRRLSGGSSASTKNLSNLNSNTKSNISRLNSKPLPAIRELSVVSSRPYSSNAALNSRRSTPVKLTKEHFQLCEGMAVYCNGDIGIIRYIGEADFADGLWIGVELRNARGRNDGSVQGRRYFSCKPGHGLMVRPSKLSVKGINGSRLLTSAQEKLASSATSSVPADNDTVEDVSDDEMVSQV